MAKIILENVSKRYSTKDKLIVKDINLEIKENEFLVLVGPSGCGKTTTLRMIAGLESITSGSIYIGDTKVNDLAPKDRNVAMVFQNYALYPHLDVFGNLAFGLKMQKRSKEEIAQKVDIISGILELSDLLKRKPGELSGGQRQRVALGRALIRDTKVMLMDEPLSNLDAKLRVQTRGEILELHSKMKRTVVYVTHDQVEAMTMGDRIAVMYDGIIQQIDIPAVVYNKPVNMFVAGFIGVPPMNFLDCTLMQETDGFAAVSSDFSIGLPQSVVKAAVKERAGRPIVLGIRPEDMSICDATGTPDFTANIDVIEGLGGEQLITACVNGQEFTVKASSELQVKSDITVGFKIDYDKIHIFDKETQVNISL